ncbi:unnamed protein product [Polarella glacialis]|uniref:Uncharacterized protein n=1 Tax=Polarella glacialis TaxID=89957 RepID=A0A813DIH5_POLGL|nr:unnamed protein product [Polarella glacialis]
MLTDESRKYPRRKGDYLSEGECCQVGLGSSLRGFAMNVNKNGVQEYLGFDAAEIDESSMALVQQYAGYAEAFDALVESSGLAASRICNRNECESILRLIQGRDEASLAAALILSANLSAPREARNREKLLRAKSQADQLRAQSEAELRVFVDRRVVHVRATLRACMGAQLRLLEKVAEAADEATTTYEEELQAGTTAEIVGLKKAVGLNGLVVTVVAEKANGRFLVGFPDGKETLVREENLCALDRPPEAAGSADLSTASSLDAQPEASPVVQRVRFKPSVGPRDGGIEAEVTAEGLSGQIVEVLIDGIACKILEASNERALVRVPACGSSLRPKVEVRAIDWQNYVALEGSGFEYYTPLGFGVCGLNVKLSAGSDLPGGRVMSVASRTSGLMNGMVLTAEPLLPLPTPAAMPVLLTDSVEVAPDWKPPFVTSPTLSFSPAPRSRIDSEEATEDKTRRYYFELEVLEIADKRSSKTLSLGFAWRLPQGLLIDESEETELQRQDSMASLELRRSIPKGVERRPSISAWVRGSGLPESAAALPRSVVIGGDLPKAFVGGQEVARINTGWRPLLDLVPGSVLGALLEVDAGDEQMRLAVFQDGERRAFAEAPVPRDWRWPSLGDPSGVVDVCGNVLRVALRQNARPPVPSLKSEIQTPPAEEGNAVNRTLSEPLE